MNNTALNIKNYGIMTLYKDTILYHTSETNLIYNNSKTFLFCSFHPQDYIDINTKYINVIQLKKDITLFFMVEQLVLDKFKVRIHSAFSNFFGESKSNLHKINIKNVMTFANKLKKTSLNGWFSSIEDKSGVEVALLNDNNLYRCISSNNFNHSVNTNWRFNNNNSIITGFRYKVSTLNNPLTLVINKKFKDIIEKYQKSVSSKNLIPFTIFEIILQNANISYFD